jgi:cation diffusion facilitator CzcD-associated flavoprotein CzcO
MRNGSVISVGGGPAGLSTAGALKAVGVQSVILDRDARIGASWLRRYDRLHLHSVSRLSGLAHFAIPKHYPKYVSKDQYAQYLQLYANHFELHVLLNTNVTSIRREGLDAFEPGFIVETDSGAWRCSTVVVATGKYAVPTIPAFLDLDRYQGIQLHASQYHTARDYAGKRVLIVGIGNTGAEIAADLVEQGAATVTISVRSMPTIVPRDLFGRGIQETGIILSRLPPRLADEIGKVVARFTVGDLRPYGIGPPQWTPFADKRTPVIDVGFLRNLKARRILVRPNISRFVSDGVVYTDGGQEAFDAAIFATGFVTGLDQILKIPGLLDETGSPRFVSGNPTSEPGLYFIGYLQSNRGLLYETEIDSRRLAATIATRRIHPIVPRVDSVASDVP